MLTLLEEVVLLTVDEQTGKLKSPREFGTAYALAGAVLFDLALAKRIDTGTDEIVITGQGSTGNAVLDRVLEDMRHRPQLTTVRQWIEDIFQRREDLEGTALQSLVDRGILRHEKSKLLWIIDVERFPMVNQKQQQHVKLRLAQAILGDDIPDTRDIMLVSLAEGCGLLGYVLSDVELESRRDRIQTLCQLETISRKITAAILSLQKLLNQAMAKVV